MLRRFQFLLKAGVGIAGCVAAIGAAQATSLTAIGGTQGDTTWQNIAGASYTFSDANHDGQLNVGEILTFTIDMHKNHWGMHDFDALKVWIGGNVYTGEWHFSTDNTRGNWDYSGAGPVYTDPDQFFSFNYTTTKTGLLDLYASVMCNADLSGLVHGDGAEGSLGIPSQADWNAWTKTIHKERWLQGEDKQYQLTVVQQPVPEPQTYAMLLAGLGLMGAAIRRRKDQQ
jgi:hypothetical protein